MVPGRPGTNEMGRHGAKATAPKHAHRRRLGREMRAESAAKAGDRVPSFLVGPVRDHGPQDELANRCRKRLRVLLFCYFHGGEGAYGYAKQ